MEITKKLQHGKQFLVTYSLKKGIEKFGEQSHQSVLKEMKQLNDQKCFKPIKKESPSTTKQKRALESLIFLTEK